MSNLIIRDINKYQESKISLAESKIKNYRRIYVILNVISILAVFASATISTLIISKLVYSSYPDWFFYATAGVSATTAFISTLLNFFFIHDNLKDEERHLKLMQLEIVKYNNGLSDKYIGKHKDFNLFATIEAINGSKAARKEIGYE